jgi:hypothetical protein
MKPEVVESRYDFRGGRNTAISSDLLNPNELVDCTNARISSTYGGFAKRTGSQRIHLNQMPAAITGVTQWDGPSGKQVVAISNGDLYYRNGFVFNAAFTKVSTAGIPRTTANQGVNAGWTASSDSLSGPVGTNIDDSAGGFIICKLGDPAVDNNVVAADGLYTVTFTATADGTAMSGTYAAIDANVKLWYSLNSGALWTAFGDGPYSATASIGVKNSRTFTVTEFIPGSPPAPIWIRLILNLRVVGLASGNGVATVSVLNGGVNYPATWTTGTAKMSTSQPAIFAPFRAATAGAPLVLYIASGGHYFSWDGSGNPTSLVQLDPVAGVPEMLPTNIISYHTRMFAMSASPTTPGLLPKTIFWSKIGDATSFATGDKTLGGKAVTDFLTGQQLTALEVIGSSLLMSTIDSVMRFTGHASDDIVISQDTEGISAEVGSVGPQTLKRYENVAAMLTDRGAYVVTETYSQPSGEQLNPDWQALDTLNLNKSSIEYNRNRKELLFAVPRQGDGGVPKSVFSQAVRLQAWQGPWVYPFAINCQGKYFDSTNLPNVIAGGTDGFIRLMDVGALDDVNADGTGGSNITMTVEIPVLHFGVPGLKKALKWMLLQANLPIGSNLQIGVSFDGGSETLFGVTPNDSGEEDYRVDTAGDVAQGFRTRIRFIDSSSQIVTINGFSLIGWNMQRST